jgi:hypothetical protein
MKLVIIAVVVLVAFWAWKTWDHYNICHNAAVVMVNAAQARDTAMVQSVKQVWDHEGCS